MAACRNKNNLSKNYTGEVRVGDLRDEDYLDRMLNGIDIICHAAGWPSFINSKKQSQKNYLEPSIDLINRAVEWRVKRFVNLSNIAVASLHNRNNPLVKGKPRRHAAMLNCMLAVEDYLKARANENFSVVNLRTGIYSGKQLQIGVLPALLVRVKSGWLPEVIGRYRYFPLVDGRDIGQAFARAALAPNLPFYESINIVGPEVPSQKSVYDFMQTAFKLPRPWIKLPASLVQLVSYPYGLIKYKHHALLPPTLTDFIANPLINNDKASQLMGYNPEIHWTASIQDYWLVQQNNPHSIHLSKPEQQPDLND